MIEQKKNLSPPRPNNVVHHNLTPKKSNKKKTRPEGSARKKTDSFVHVSKVRMIILSLRPPTTNHTIKRKRIGILILQKALKFKPINPKKGIPEYYHVIFPNGPMSQTKKTTSGPRFPLKKANSHLLSRHIM